MRRLILLLPAVVAACTAPPPPKSVPGRVIPVEIPVERGELIGLQASELQTRLGPPALTVREGAGLKLQFRAASCVLDAFLYSNDGGSPRVAHVEARTRDGADSDQAACTAILTRR